MSKSHALSVKNLTVIYDYINALSDVNLQLSCGRMTAIIGPNGAGKSTFIKSIMDTIPKESGTVHFFDKPLKSQRHRVSYVPQRAAVDWDFPATVFDVVKMGLYSQLGPWRRMKPHQITVVNEAIDQMGLTQLRNRPIGALSGGQQQRVFLARALVQRADLYLLDEPLAGVDATTEHVIISLLKKLRDDGCTIVVVHHDLSTVKEYFDDIILLNKTIINHGSVKHVFTPDNIAKTYGNTPVVQNADQLSVFENG